MLKKTVNRMLALLLTGSMLTGCGTQNISDTKEAELITEEGNAEMENQKEIVTNLPQIDHTKWQYNKEDNVYYQIGISYCEKPADVNYETLSIFVPGDYMTATDNGDGTYTCEVNSKNTVGNYNALTAPFVFPVNTPGYAAQNALTEYQSFTEYTNQGMIYVHAGCRGRDAGAPAGVTDLKAAIRYIRYNEGNIAGNTERIFSFGMSGGGAQSVLLGITGDSELYDDYLTAIGAVQGVSDSLLGSMGWCPITSLDTADAAYEWNMGNTRTELSSEEQNISDELTKAYAEYINSIGLKDSDGNLLTLEESENGRYQAGTYYEYIKEQVEKSLNNFLEDTTFPYNADSSSRGHMAGMRGHDAPDGNMPDGGGMPDRDKAPDDKNADIDFSAIDDIARTDSKSGISISGTYETVQDYINALNAETEWVIYDENTNTATITSLEDFTKAVKNSSKGIAAFDQLDGNQGENTLFGYGDGKGAHFDATLAEILKTEGNSYAEEYVSDLAKEDAVGHNVEYRLNMYSPMYYLLDSSEGYETSSIAKYFRIRTGAWQSDTSITTEINLALTLEQNDNVENVDFATVWGQEHTMAERTGDSTTNFCEWINACCANEQ